VLRAVYAVTKALSFWTVLVSGHLSIYTRWSNGICVETRRAALTWFVAERRGGTMMMGG
jgi:hypothetical protein